MRVFSSLDASVRAAAVPWIAEMIRGMGIYACRHPGEDGIVAVETLSDLERYCWFVAGTVGRMLTELFSQHLGGSLEEGRRRVLEANAEDFALGLQLTNILKDVTDDRARRISYVPRALSCAEGVPLAELVHPARRAAAHRVLAPIFARARRALDGAFAYTLAIPASAPGIRLFCLLPVFMAVRTLRVAEGNDDIFAAESKVKISRAEVAEIIDGSTASVDDDDALRARFSALSAP
jgi:farnesyl-diphosphate farnesyltransferase